jgi:hypothetical protein
LFGLEQSRRLDTPLFLQANNDTPPSLSSHAARAKLKRTKNELKTSTTNFLHILAFVFNAYLVSGNRKTVEMKLHQTNCLFTKNVMIPNKIEYKPRWECVSFLSRALAHLD